MAVGTLLWGNNAVTSTFTTRYLTPGYADNTAQVAATLQFRLPAAGRLRRMFVRHNTPAGNGNPIVYTVRINGVASALAVSLNSNVSDGSDLVDVVVVAAGDLVDVEVTKAADVGTSPNNIIAILEYA